MELHLEMKIKIILREQKYTCVYIYIYLSIINLGSLIPYMDAGVSTSLFIKVNGFLLTTYALYQRLHLLVATSASAHFFLGVASLTFSTHLLRNAAPTHIPSLHTSVETMLEIPTVSLPKRITAI